MEINDKRRSDLGASDVNRKLIDVFDGERSRNVMLQKAVLGYPLMDP